MDLIIKGCEGSDVIHHNNFFIGITAENWTLDNYFFSVKLSLANFTIKKQNRKILKRETKLNN